jgi:hypothetical protein
MLGESEIHLAEGQRFKETHQEMRDHLKRQMRSETEMCGAREIATFLFLLISQSENFLIDLTLDQILQN